MGEPKALLTVGGETLAARTARVLLTGGAQNVLLVVAPNSPVPAAVQEVALVDTVLNPEPERGMLSSVQVGLRSLLSAQPHTRAFLVCPCDLPLLKPNHTKVVLDKWREAGAPGDAIVAPVFGGKRGHPTLFGTAFAEEILELDSEEFGLNEILRRHESKVLLAPVDDDGPLLDADTPEEWRALTGRR